MVNLTLDQYKEVFRRTYFYFMICLFMLIMSKPLVPWYEFRDLVTMFYLALGTLTMTAIMESFSQDYSKLVYRAHAALIGAFFGFASYLSGLHGFTDGLYAWLFAVTTICVLAGMSEWMVSQFNQKEDGTFAFYKEEQK